MNDSRASALLKQMELVEARMRHHLVRFWSSPVAYLGIVFVSLKENSDSKILLGALTLAGILVLTAMYAAKEGVERYIKEVRRLENELSLKETPRYRRLQFYPYIMITTLGMLYSLALLLT